MLRFILVALAALLVQPASAQQVNMYWMCGTGLTAWCPTTSTNPIPVITVPSTIGSLTPIVGGSAASSQVLKASAGSLYSVYAHCTSACWLMVFNSATAPSNGATTAGTASGGLVECVAIPANTTAGLNYGPGPPATYSVGITATISSTSCGTLTLSTVGFIHGLIAP